MPSLQVLIVEDNEDDAELVVRELSRGGYQVAARRVDTPEDMHQALAGDASFDVVISDYSMPRFDAVAALAVLREHTAITPFVIVSGTIGEDVAVAAMRMGAQDYLVKGKLKRLVPAVERELRDARARIEQLRAEEALSRSEARFRALIEALPDMVVVARDGQVTYVNPPFEYLLGIRASRALGGPLTAFVHPDDHERVGHLLEAVQRGEMTGPALDQQRWLRQDGVILLVEVTPRLLELEGQRVVVVVARDVTSRRATEEALRASELRFRTLVSSIEDLVYTLDREQRFRGVYGRWQAREGLAPETFLGRTPSEVFGVHVGAAHSTAFRRVLAGSPIVFEWSLSPAGQKARHYQTSLSPLVGHGDQVTGAVGVTRETTEQKRVQAQLLVSDRMASVGTLAAGVAHEINNPLAAVMANLDHIVAELSRLRAEKGFTDAAAGRLGDIEESLGDAGEAAGRVHNIVRDLKIFSRGGNEERRTALDVVPVIDSSVRMAWNEIRHRAQLVKDYTPVPFVDGNEARLGQVFLNLIVNAAQAIPEGRAKSNEIRIRVRLDSEMVVVEISDTGPGIEPEVMERLFTPFFTTKPVGVGTGLGLSICHGIVTGLGGTIHIESLVGSGTTCRVALPVAAQITRPPEPEPRRASQPARRGKVLVVDDEHMIGVAIRRALASMHDVTVTTHASEALVLLAAGAVYDVILCDVMMPEVTGMDMYEELAKIDPSQLERIIFMTGGAFTSRARSFIDTIPNARIEKPFDAVGLRNIVNERIK